MTAEEAINISEVGYKVKTEAHISTILDLIRKAAMSGLFSVKYELYFNDDIAKCLQELGYTIKRFPMDGNALYFSNPGDYVKISWNK